MFYNVNSIIYVTVMRRVYFSKFYNLYWLIVVYVVNRGMLLTKQLLIMRFIIIDIIADILLQGKFFRCNDISKMTKDECQ